MGVASPGQVLLLVYFCLGGWWCFSCLSQKAFNDLVVVQLHSVHCET